MSTFVIVEWLWFTPKIFPSLFSKEVLYYISENLLSYIIRLTIFVNLLLCFKRLEQFLDLGYFLTLGFSLALRKPI